MDRCNLISSTTENHGRTLYEQQTILGNRDLSSLTMATIMSGLISGYKMGFSHEWPPIWLQSFLIAWPCAITLNLTVLPLIRKLSAWICRPRTLCVPEITER
ncbi:MFS transporter permease [Vibrio splendidus]|nr:MFS transporter permease [Vibrio splendidus]